MALFDSSGQRERLLLYTWYQVPGLPRVRACRHRNRPGVLVLLSVVVKGHPGYTPGG